jgi:hypothetical protein
MTGQQGFSVEQSVGLSVFNTAISAWSAYNTSKHNAEMADIQWNFNKGMQLENLKINTFILNNNKVALLTADRTKQLQIETQEMQAKAAAEVAQAAYGMQGGSAQQVLHSISREAEQAQSARIVERDQALFENKMQGIKAQQSSRADTGLRPIDATSGSLHVFAAGSKITDTFGTLYDPIRER